MSRREGKGPPSRDLLVCFPARAHLTLMPKPFASPRRRHLPLPYHHHQNHHLRKSMSRGGHASPHLWSGSKQMSSDNLSEPTSPKVTCAGQIKVRPSTRSCRNWQTVMEEIERLHNNRKKKPTTWMEALGFKKEVMQFLSCLRRIKFDFRCLGAFSHVDITSDDEEEEDGDNNDDKEISYHCDHDKEVDDEASARTMFSKWFMVLQENQDCGVFEKDENSLKETEDPPCLPPANALLLMRCRSAPAKSWMEEKQHQEDNDHDREHADDDVDKKTEKKENHKRKSLMELMKYESDFHKLSTNIAKETWVVGGIHKHPFSRSTSWKR